MIKKNLRKRFEKERPEKKKEKKVKIYMIILSTNLHFAQLIYTF